MAKVDMRSGRYVAHWMRRLDVSLVEEKRATPWVRWSLGKMLKTLLSGLIAGKQGFREAEDLSDDFTPDVLRALGVGGGISDTAMQEFVVRADVEGIRALLKREAAASYRSKSLDVEHSGAPIGMVSIDGKYDAAKVRVNRKDDHEVQRKAMREQYPFFQPKGAPTGNWQRGELRTMSVVLSSSQAPVYLDCVPVRGETNEMGMFPEVFDALMVSWGSKGLFQLVSVDAGMTSKANADLVVSHKVHYLMAVKETQQEILRELRRLVGDGGESGYDSHCEERVRGETVHYFVWRTKDIAQWNDWPHLQQGIRIRRKVVHSDPDKPDSVEDRYYVSSLPWERLDANQWAGTVRMHWCVENQAHKTLDVTFMEGKHPWTRNPHGMLVMLLLRRVVFNRVSLFRNVHLRSDSNRKTPWKKLLQRFCDVFRFSHLSELLRERERPEQVAAVQ